MESDPIDLIEKNKTAFTKEYKEVKISIDSNKEAINALNDYASSVLSSFDDLFFRDNEGSRIYSNRVSNLKHEISKKANYLKLQM